MRIEKENLCIRNAQEKDCEVLAAWWNDGKVMAHAGFPNGLGTSSEKIKSEIKNDNDEIHRRLILEYNHYPIGEMSYSIEDNEAELGIKICDENFQNKGLGRKALSMLIKELFSRGIDCIVLDTNLKNLRAQHVYEKLGFVKEEVEYDCWKNQLGELQSTVFYELYPEQFKDFS